MVREMCGVLGSGFCSFVRVTHVQKYSGRCRRKNIQYAGRGPGRIDVLRHPALEPTFLRQLALAVLSRRAENISDRRQSPRQKVSCQIGKKIMRDLGKSACS